MNNITNEILPILRSLATSVFAATIVSGIFQHYTGKKLEILKRETNKLEKSQERIEARSQTRYSWLHEERAKVMREIYTRILDAEDAFDDFLRSWGDMPKQAGPLVRYQAAYEAWRAFYTTYRPQRLLFTSEIAKTLDDYNKWFVMIANAYQRHIVLEKRDEYAAFHTMYEEIKENLPRPQYRSDLEAEFRRLYGTLEE